MYYFWKIMYAIKYWRVFLQPAEQNEASRKAPETSRPKGIGKGKFISYLFVVLVPLAMGLGFGYLHLQIRQQLSDQATIVQLGVSVPARIEALKVERSQNRAVGPDRSARPDSENCIVAFRYSPPGSNTVIRKQLRLRQLTICQKYKVGASVKAWVVPADPRVFVLDDDRIESYWYWISLALFIAFTGLAIIFLRAILGSPRRQTPRK